MRVLVVEDERGLADGLRIGLEADGFAVDVAFDGPEGLWRASECTYDVIVLDLMLPGMSGFEVCARLREQGVWSPILVLTAKEGEWDEVEALDTGADDFLTQAGLARGAGGPAPCAAAPPAPGAAGGARRW